MSLDVSSHFPVRIENYWSILLDNKLLQGKSVSISGVLMWTFSKHTHVQTQPNRYSFGRQRVWGEAFVYFKAPLVLLKQPKLRTSSITHGEIPVSVNSCWANQRMTKSSPCGFCLLLVLQLTLFLISNSIFYTYFLFWVQDAPSQVLVS